MKNLLRGILCFALVVGMATPSEAVICCLIDKLAELTQLEECAAIRKLRAEHRAKKTAKKMKAKKPLFAGLKKSLENRCCCDLGCDCDAECGCGCD